MNRFSFYLAALVTALALPALAHDGLEISDAYARFMPGGRAGAAFFVIENHGSGDDRLVSVHSEVAERTELHTHKADASGMMQMLPIEGGLPVTAGSRVVLERGGDHVMFMGVIGKPADGDVVALTLSFEKAGDIVVEVPVDNAR